MIVKKGEHKTIYEITPVLMVYLCEHINQELDGFDLRFHVNDETYGQLYDLWSNVTAPREVFNDWCDLVGELDFVYGNTEYFLLTTREAPEDDSR